MDRALPAVSIFLRTSHSGSLPKPRPLPCRISYGANLYGLPGGWHMPEGRKTATFITSLWVGSCIAIPSLDPPLECLGYAMKQVVVTLRVAYRLQIANAAPVLKPPPLHTGYAMGQVPMALPRLARHRPKDGVTPLGQQPPHVFPSGLLCIWHVGTGGGRGPGGWSWHVGARMGHR